MPAPVDRDARLDELIKAVDKWAKARTAHLNRILSSQKKLLDSRSSPSKNATDAAVDVVVEELKEFLG